MLMGLLIGIVLPQQVQADEWVSALVDQLKQGQVSEPALQGKGMQSADGLFLLGWLYDQGRYGVTKNPGRAHELLQQSAELGQFDAMRYCWPRCLVLTPAVLEQLRQGVEQERPQALYLQGQYLRQQGQDQQAQVLLEQAASQHYVDAVGQRYVDQFVVWARDKRSLNEAVSRLERCVDGGLTVCYYLLAAFYQKHDDPQWALFYYQVLSLVDPELYLRYQAQSQIAGLLKLRPQPDLGVVRSRAASYLSQRGVTGNDRIDRFQRCRAAGSLECVESISQADLQCLLMDLESSLLRGLRDSVGYLNCVKRLGSG